MNRRAATISTPDETQVTFETVEEYARNLDDIDPLREYRDMFCHPGSTAGDPLCYFAGNSLGLMPKATRSVLHQELDDWAKFGVDAHFKARTPWYSYHEIFRESGARLVGAIPGEVVMMNSLTINLHLMLVTFYQPTTERFRILIEEPCFPSDLYAFKTHLHTRGIKPEDALLVAKPRTGEHTIRMEDIEALLDSEGEKIALVLIGGVNFVTGQVFDMKRIAKMAHQHGCVVGFDLAHAAGNIDLHLHDWDVDFAVWCSYKYLNSGAGAVAGCFVHERHGKNLDLPRYAGWWGNDPETRFQMHLQKEFIPQPGAEGWQISNPPILSMAPLKVSIELFDEVGMTALRAKSKMLTGYLRFLLGNDQPSWLEIITPLQDNEHGCQLSIAVNDDPKKRFDALQSGGAKCDFRPPNVIRLAPVPFYNSYHEVWQVAKMLSGNK